MNSTPIISARIIRFTALLPPPPTPMTRMSAKFSESERKDIASPPGGTGTAVKARSGPPERARRPPPLRTSGEYSAGRGPRADPETVVAGPDLSLDEAEPDRPLGVVDVRVDEGDRLPRAEREPAVDDGDRERRRDDRRQHVVRPVARRPVPVDPALLPGQEPFEGRGEVLLA